MKLCERAYATARFRLEELRALARDIGGTINDALLALTAGALRRYLLRHHELAARHGQVLDRAALAAPLGASVPATGLAC